MNKVHITISTTAGDLEDDFPTNQPLHALKRQVMARLKLDPSQADQYILTLDGQVLDETKTLSELMVEAGSVLILERKEAIKI